MGISLLNMEVSPTSIRWREPGGGVQKDGALMRRTIIPDTWDRDCYDCHRTGIYAGTKYRITAIYPQ
jgi:hypothetical protein